MVHIYIYIILSKPRISKHSSLPVREETELAISRKSRMVAVISVRIVLYLMPVVFRVILLSNLWWSRHGRQLTKVERKLY